jgi:hypothetical protein
VTALSFAVSILKILAGQPEGRAPIARLKAYLEIFYASGPEWTARTKALAVRAPGLDIFARRLVVREDGEWRITAEGPAALQALEREQSESAAPTEWDVAQVDAAVLPLPPMGQTRRSKGAARWKRAREPRLA